jgi:hypothetical protein
MEVTAKCPGCDRDLLVGGDEALPAIACGACGRRTTLDWSDAVRRDEAVDRCPVCSGGDFYGRKDLDPKLGLTFVILGALVSAGFLWFAMDRVAYSVLGVAVLIDLLVFRRLGDLTVCYRCHSEFRGRYRPTAPTFDLHVADELEPEYERRIGRR